MPSHTVNDVTVQFPIRIEIRVGYDGIGLQLVMVGLEIMLITLSQSLFMF